MPFKTEDSRSPVAKMIAKFHKTYKFHSKLIVQDPGKARIAKSQNSSKL